MHAVNVIFMNIIEYAQIWISVDIRIKQIFNNDLWHGQMTFLLRYLNCRIDNGVLYQIDILYSAISFAVAGFGSIFDKIAEGFRTIISFETLIEIAGTEDVTKDRKQKQEWV